MQTDPVPDALAAVDLGSNSFHMVVARVVGQAPAIIDRLREQVQLGAGLDENKELLNFANTLEKVCVDTVEAGDMTKDLALLVGPDQKWLTTIGFLDKIDENLNKALGG